MPFYANFGYYPIDNYPAEVVESHVPAAEEYFENLAKLRKDMGETLILARERMAKYYNRNVFEKEPTFKVGDKAMVNAKNIKMKRKSKKLDHKMRGPFKVKRLIGSYPYELALAYGAGKVHPVYHISILDPYHRNDIPRRRSPSPQPVIDLGDDIWEVAKILASRVHRKRVQYLVRWKGSSLDKDTWEPYDNIIGGSEESVQDFLKDNPDQERDPRVKV